MFAWAGPNMPHELIEASGRSAGPLRWSIDRPLPAADRWLESKFAPWTRSVLQDWADGALDHLEAVIFSRADDNAHRLYYYLCELRRNGALIGPEPLVLDIAKTARASSRAHNELMLRRLGDRLGVGDAALAAAIDRANRERATPRPGPSGSAPLCLISGSPPPDDRLHRAAAVAGWQASGPTLADVWADRGPAVAIDANPWAALAAQLQLRSNDARGFQDRAAALAAAASGAQAALLWLIEEDEAGVWQVPAQRAVLARLGVPALVATRRDWCCRDGIMAELTEFLTQVRP